MSLMLHLWYEADLAIRNGFVFSVIHDASDGRFAEHIMVFYFSLLKIFRKPKDVS